MPRRSSKANQPATLVFGKDWIPLSSRASDGDGECKCLQCTGELIEIQPMFAVEVVRRLVKAYREITDSAHEVIRFADPTDWPSLENAIRELESGIKGLNVLGDAILPWVVWYASPKQRASKRKPVALDALLKTLQYIEYLHEKLMLGGDFESGGELWNYSKGIIAGCEKQVEALLKALNDDRRVGTALAGHDATYIPKLRLTRADPVESWHFCSADCCKKYEDSVLAEEQAAQSTGSPHSRLWDFATKSWAPTTDKYKIAKCLKDGDCSYSECVEELAPGVSRTAQTNYFHAVKKPMNAEIKDLGLAVQRDKQIVKVLSI